MLLHFERIREKVQHLCTSKGVGISALVLYEVFLCQQFSPPLRQHCFSLSSGIAFNKSEGFCKCYWACKTESAFIATILYLVSYTKACFTGLLINVFGLIINLTGASAIFTMLQFSLPLLTFPFFLLKPFSPLTCICITQILPEFFPSFVLSFSLRIYMCIYIYIVCI